MARKGGPVIREFVYGTGEKSLPYPAIVTESGLLCEVAKGFVRRCFMPKYYVSVVKGLFERRKPECRGHVKHGGPY
jgi:hypothetical protein